MSRVQATIAVRDSVVASTDAGNTNSFNAGVIPFGGSAASALATITGTTPSTRVLGWFTVPYFPNVGLDIFLKFSGTSNSLNGGVGFNVWVDLMNDPRTAVVGSSSVVTVPATYATAIVRLAWNVSAFITAGAVVDKLILVRFAINSTVAPPSTLSFHGGQMWIDTAASSNSALILTGVSTLA